MQVTFLDFWTALLTALCDFLLTEPIIYFTAITVLLAVSILVKKMI